MKEVKWFDFLYPAKDYREKLVGTDNGIFVFQKIDGTRRICVAPITTSTNYYGPARIYNIY